jgi:hypothetical protein
VLTGTIPPLPWIGSLFGHITGEHPHLEHIRDAGELAGERDRGRQEHDTVRLHSSIGYLTPDEEHAGHGEAIRAHRRAGLAEARPAPG